MCKSTYPRSKAAARRDNLLKCLSNYVLSTRHRPQIDGYLLMQSLSRVVKYQSNVLCVINLETGTSKIEFIINGPNYCASRVPYATSISKLHLHPSGLIASISHIIHTIQRKRDSITKADSQSTEEITNH